MIKRNSKNNSNFFKYDNFKRFFDLIFAILLMILFLPILILISFLVSFLAFNTFCSTFGIIPKPLSKISPFSSLCPFKK